jgi:hypothetical protein
MRVVPLARMRQAPTIDSAMYPWDDAGAFCLGAAIIFPNTLCRLSTEITSAAPALAMSCIELSTFFFAFLTAFLVRRSNISAATVGWVVGHYGVIDGPILHPQPIAAYRVEENDNVARRQLVSQITHKAFGLSVNLDLATHNFDVDPWRHSLVPRPLRSFVSETFCLIVSGKIPQLLLRSNEIDARRRPYQVCSLRNRHPCADRLCQAAANRSDGVNE